MRTFLFAGLDFGACGWVRVSVRMVGKVERGCVFLGCCGGA